MQIRIDSNAIYEALSRPLESAEEDLVLSGIAVVTEKESQEGSVIIPRTELPTPFDYAKGSFYKEGSYYFGGISLYLPEGHATGVRVEEGGLFRKLIKRVEPKELVLPNDFFLEHIRNRLEETYGAIYRPSKEGVSGFILDKSGEPVLSIERYEEEVIREEKELSKIRKLWIQIGGSGLKRRRFNDNIDFGVEVKQLSDVVTTFVNFGLEKAIEIGLIKEENSNFTLRLGPSV